MSWVYKMKNKVSKDDLNIGSMLAACPKCHYILLIREGEKPIYCPMCGSQNLETKGNKK